jgi:Pyridine nucleotide-disulphide oxidoreductase
MAMWRNHMPKGMLLKSDGFATNLASPDDAFPLSRYCGQVNHPYADVGFRTPIETLLAYAKEFQHRYVGAVEEAVVAELSLDKGQYALRLNSGEIVSARKVIVATGLFHLQRLPANLASLPKGTVSHASDHNDLSTFAGQRVVVIGGGQSAVETAALLNEHGAHVTLVSRRPIIWFSSEEGSDVKSLWTLIRRPNFGLGPGWRSYFWSDMPRAYSFLPQRFRLSNAYSVLGPAGSGWTRHRVEGVVPTHVGPVLGAEYRFGEIRLIHGQDQHILAADHVIAATGYTADVTRLPFLRQMQRNLRVANGAPVLDRQFQSVSAEGLHFVGYLSAPTFGPSMRFIYGTRFAATRIARHIAREYQGRRHDRRLMQQPA